MVEWSAVGLSLGACRLITGELCVEGLRVEQPSEVCHHAACTRLYLHKRARRQW
jgi:hypothetical protein